MKKAKALASYLLKVVFSWTERRGTETTRRRRKSADGKERTGNVSPTTATTAPRVRSRFQMASTGRTKYRASFLTGTWKTPVGFHLWLIFFNHNGKISEIENSRGLQHLRKAIGNICGSSDNVRESSEVLGPSLENFPTSSESDKTVELCGGPNGKVFSVGSNPQKFALLCFKNCYNETRDIVATCDC